jgi:hypothetical protein
VNGRVKERAIEEVKSATRAERGARGYSLSELMVAAAAREVRDADMVFVWMRLPMPGFLVARRTHAPLAMGLYENGVIRETPATQLLYTWPIPPTCAVRHFAGRCST